MKPPFSIALISLPGAHLAQLAQLLCELTGRDNAVDCEIGAARGCIYVLPSDFFSDVCVGGSGTLAEIADRVHLALSDFEA